MGIAGTLRISAGHSRWPFSTRTSQGKLGEASLVGRYHVGDVRVRRHSPGAWMNATAIEQQSRRARLNFGTIFDLPLRMWPEKEALIYGVQRITYATLEQRTNRVANGLLALGIGKGDHVAVLVKNDPRFVETVLGALRTGATATPMTTRAHYTTLAHIVADANARVLFASADFVEEAKRLAAESSDLQHVFVMDADVASTRRYDGWLDAQSDRR